jgi:hypothetical protein
MSRLIAWVSPLGLVGALSGQTLYQTERFVAPALSSAGTVVRTSLEIEVERWSNESDGEHLVAALRRGGIDAVIAELQRHEAAGRLRGLNGLTRTIRYARETRLTSGARQLLFVFDPPVDRSELFAGTGSIEHRLAAIAVWLGPAGEGEGQVTELARVGIDSFGALTVDFRDPSVLLPSVTRQESR